MTTNMTDKQWDELKIYLEEYKNNPDSNYSDKDRFFRQLFDAFIQAYEKSSKKR